MPATKPRSSMSATVVEWVGTGIDPEAPLTGEFRRDDERQQEWQRLIDNRLIDWGCNPDQFEDEGIERLSSRIITLAIRLAQQLQSKGIEPPDSVVPDPNGGVVFEWQDGGSAEAYHIWDDASVEYQRFNGTHLVERRML